MPDTVSETIQRSSPMRVSPRHLTKLEKAMRLTVQPNADHDPPFVLWVSGKAGVGKSTLIQAAARVLEGDGAVVVGGEAFPHTGEILEPVLQCARSLVTLTREQAELGAPGWTTAWDEVVTRHAPALDRVLPEVDWGREVTPYPDISPEHERSRLLDHLSGLFLRVADEVPLFLQLDGAEHLDGLSHELILTLARVVRTRRQGMRAGLPLPAAPRLGVIAVTSQHDRLPLEIPDEEVLSVTLNGLAREEFARVLGDEFGEEVPLSVREKLYQKTHGNPLDLRMRMQRQRANNPEHSAQESFREMLDFDIFEEERTQELDAMDVAQRELLQVLALLEKPVSVDILCRLLEQSPGNIESMVEQLMSEFWVRSTGASVVRLAHGRLAPIVLDTISEVCVPTWHRRAAEAINASYEGRANRRFQEVHYHYSRGSQDVESVSASFLAAEEARRLYDFKGAIRIYRGLLEFIRESAIDEIVAAVSALADLLLELPGTDERLLTQLERHVLEREDRLPAQSRASLWRRLGSVAGKWGLHDKEATFFNHGIQSLDQDTRCQERVLLYASIARAYLRHREYDETLRYCQEGFELTRLKDLTHDPEFLEICRVTEEVHFHRGEFIEALEFEEQFLEIAKETSNSVETLDSLLRLAHLYDQRGEPERAREQLVAALPEARASGSRLLEARIDEHLGYFHSRREEWREATAAFRRALQVHTEIGDEQRSVRLFGALGMVSLFTGDSGAGARSFRLYALYQGLRVRAEIPAQVPGFPCDYRSRAEREEEIRLREETLSRSSQLPASVMVDTLAELADLQRDRGEMQVARATVRRARRTAEAQGMGLARYHLQLGILHRLQGEIEPALSSFIEGLNSMSAYPDPERVAETHLQVGLLYLGRGEYRRALGKMVRALRGYLELEHDTGVTHSLIQLGHVYQQIGAVEAAEELGLAALALADTLRVDRLEAEAWLLLATIRRARPEALSGQHEVTLARELFNKLGILEGRCRALLVEADIFHRAEDQTRAASLVGEGLEIARDLGLRYQLANGLALRGAIEGDRRGGGGDFLRALQSLEGAREHNKSLGDRRLRLRIHATVAQLYHERGRPGGAQTHVAKVRRSLKRLLGECPKVFKEQLVQNHEGAQLLQHYEDHIESRVVAT